MSTQKTPTEQCVTASATSFSEVYQIALENIRRLGGEKAVEKFLEEYEAKLKMTASERIEERVNIENRQTGNLHGYDCPICLNRGYIAVVKDNEIVYHTCECEAVRQTLTRIEASGLKKQLESSRLDNFEAMQPFQKDMKQKAIDYIRKKDTWFLICGQSGCGKTHICTAMVGERIKQGKRAIYMPYRDEIIKLKQIVTDADAYQQRINQFKQTDLLYIDDLFKGKVTDADINLIYEIIGYRYSNNLETIISTELMIEDMQKIDEAIMDRIYERAGVYVIQIAGDTSKNYRLKK